MNKKEQAPVIVITGGTGSGKSTVAAVFNKMGARLIDVDRFAHRFLKPGSPAWQQLMQNFTGTKLCQPKKFGEAYKPSDFLDAQQQPLKELPWLINRQGLIQRDKLGARVFSDSMSLEQLNKIIHPRLRKALDSKLATHRRLSNKPVVLDMAVYPEKIFRGLGDVVLWVRAPGGLRAQRLADHRRLGLEEASARIRIQWKDDDFKKVANFILPNLGSDTDLKKAAEALWPQLLKFAYDGGK